LVWAGLCRIRTGRRRVGKNVAEYSDVAAIVDDTIPNHVTLVDLAVNPPALRDEQRARIAHSTSACRYGFSVTGAIANPHQLVGYKEKAHARCA